MKRAPILEDWSRFNRAVLDVANGVQPAAAKQPAPQPKREPTDFVPEPIDRGDAYGLIARHKWRKHA